MIRSIQQRETLPISEIVTKTARLSPFEDFKKRTLAAIDGVWARLLYVTNLRAKNGRYEHWGHNRTHGELNSQAALAQAHSELYLQVLRMPLRDLMNDLGTEGSAVSSKEVSELMIPANLEGGSPRHFNSVALAAELLGAARQASTHSTA
jgi:hypothetical protein